MPIAPDKLHLIEPVLEWLDAGAPHKGKANHGFNMGFFITTDREDYKEESCGTAVCIAGAIAQFNNFSIQPNTMYDKGISFVVEALGITREEGDALFVPSEYDHGLLDDLTPYMAAATVRHFIATGKVDWTAGGAPDYRNGS